MTQEEKQMKRYTNAVERRLNLPFAIKVRVMNDFISSIAARREAGQTDQEIYRELGDPKTAAADLNAQMADYAFRKSPWRWPFLALAILAGLWLLGELMSWLLAFLILHQHQPEAGSIGIIGGADGPTSIFVTATVTDGGSWGWLLAGMCLLVGIYGYHRFKRWKGK